MRVYNVSLKDTFFGDIDYLVFAESDIQAEKVILDMYPTCKNLHSELVSVRGVIDGSNYKFSKK